MNANQINSLSIVRQAETTEIAYGESTVSLPISDTVMAEIDSAFLAGKGTLRLKNIKVCLKLAGKPNDKENRTWFNKEVRDPYHKALRFLNKEAMKNGKPVSIGISRRITKKTGVPVVTAKFGYEMTPKSVEPETPAQLEDAKAKRQSQAKAKRQTRKASKPLSNPVIPAERNVTVEPVTVEAVAPSAPVS